MTFVPDAVLDLPLEEIATGTYLYLCSAQPADYEQASDTYLLGGAVPSFSGPADASPNGRKITVAAITAGEVQISGTATHWAIANDPDQVILATKALASSIAVLVGAEFTLTAFDIRMPDPT